MDDLYNNLKIYEPEVKGTSSSSTNTQNVAFVSSNSTNSTNRVVNTAHGTTTASTQATAVNSTTIDNLSDAVIYGLEVADGYANNKARRLLKNTGRKLTVNGTETIRDLRNQENRNRESTRRSVRMETTTSNALISCLESVEARLLVYKKNESVYEEDIKVLKRKIYLKEVAITELRRKLELAQKQKDEIQLTVEKFENSSKNINKLLDCQIVDKCKTEEFVNEPIVNEPTVKKSVVETSEAKASADKPKEEDMPQAKKEKKTVKSSFAKIKFVKSKEQVKSPRKTIVKQVSLTTARPVNTAQPRTTVNSARPMTNVFNKAHSTVRRPINNKTATKNSNFNQRVNTVSGKNVNTARPKAVVNTAKPKAVLNAVKGNQVNAVKASACWVWKPKTKGNPQMDLQDQGVIDSGCSRYMTGNMSYLTDFEEIDGGYVAFGGNPKGGKIIGR
ncbi:hypothetical protein Tco_0901278, partial [Tanacetum coccineum]